MGMRADQIIAEFIKNVRVLTKTLFKLHPEDPILQRSKKRLNLVIDINPVHVIESIGFYLYGYRNEILNYNSEIENFFLENTFDKELSESVIKEKADEVKYIMPKLKSWVATLDQETKNEYIEIVQELVCLYADYLLTLT